MLSKLLATFFAWALAPLSMLFLMYLPFYFYTYINGYTGTNDFRAMAHLLWVSYVITAIVGLTTHAALLIWRKDRVRNYALVGFAAVVIWYVLVIITDGFPKHGIEAEHVNWFLMLSVHGVIVATSFAIIYKKVYRFITRLKTTLGVHA